jgi:tRNA(Arg) A34 adenosine deaminase TadA
MDANDDIKYMEMALREAEKAADDGEVPTGCVIVAERFSSALVTVAELPVHQPTSDIAGQSDGLLCAQTLE